MSQAGSAQAAQTGLVAALGADLAQAWDSMSDLPRFFALVAALIHRYALASAALAAQFYAAERAAAGVVGTFRVPPAPLPPLEQIGATLGWATAPLRADPSDLDLARTQVTGAVDRLVLNVGRQTLVDAVRTDRRAQGWARVTRPGACSFCRLLATRGAVYKSQASAGRSANARFVGEGEFKWHNHCHCYIEPVFNSYEPTAQARADLALYRQVTAGKSGADARNAFRVAVEAQQ